MSDYSTKHISQTLLDELVTALKSVSPYGSVEIYVQNSTVTQITVRNIKKTSVATPTAVLREKKIGGMISIVAHAHTQ
ncbi:hypothetical protein A2973_02290 [Candidatus Gottesmanbacteria bacterium RIFCSPLOWO2_01_FULL_49_10]|uniref:DUF2292 domain-containing protein n=1 Tax=Candidatus Gottesmanbacteria bacterium RIFCSPLOWO2_01_FULL_49_10 TaxID=1798396 RepID=A0A1F6AZK4_9BACT|nr:MAG: hypothetical protein UY10_C0035G0005 [Microgenomates group bacterium GW2011_GWA2_47_8]OGG30114.1 MAG: hypothetical protein A2973_02290 [Candidatus Gottesmanbacteria bacterium RIFCSPLOWO2_01_FULL_49_10]